MRKVILCDLWNPESSSDRTVSAFVVNPHWENGAAQIELIGNWLLPCPQRFKQSLSHLRNFRWIELDPKLEKYAWANILWDLYDETTKEWPDVLNALAVACSPK